MVDTVICRVDRCLLEDRCHVKTAAFGPDLDQAKGRAFVKNDDQQTAAYYADKYTLSLALMKNGRESVLTDELCHAARGRNIARGERRKAGRVHVADLTVKGDRLAVAVDEKDHAGGTLGTKPRQHGLELGKLVFLQYKRRFCHLDTLVVREEGEQGIELYKMNYAVCGMGGQRTKNAAKTNLSQTSELQQEDFRSASPASDFSEIVHSLSNVLIKNIDNAMGT